MRSLRRVAPGARQLLVVLGAAIIACTVSTVPDSAPLVSRDGRIARWGTEIGHGLELCKRGPVGTYSFTLATQNSAVNGDYSLPQGSSFSLTIIDPAVDDCKIVYQANTIETAPNAVTITEILGPGVTVSGIKVWHHPDETSFEFPGSTTFTVPTSSPDLSGQVMSFDAPSGTSGYTVEFTNEVTPTCLDQAATNYGGPLPCEYPPPGKTFTIGPSSMEGHLKIPINSWFNGGYSFKFKSSAHAATQFTVDAKVEIAVTCPYGGGPGGTILIPLGARTYSVPAGNTNWLPTGDANSILSWMGAIRTPDLCGGFPMDNAKGAVFTATVSQNPVTGSLVDFRFKYRDPAAKGKVDTNCTDPNEPKRNDAATCGASWSQTVTDP